MVVVHAPELHSIYPAGTIPYPPKRIYYENRIRQEKNTDHPGVIDVPIISAELKLSDIEIDDLDYSRAVNNLRSKIGAENYLAKSNLETANLAAPFPFITKGVVGARYIFKVLQGGNKQIRLSMEMAEQALSNVDKLKHGFKHAKDIKSFQGINWNNSTTKKAWIDFNKKVMGEADNTFLNRLGQDDVIGFYKRIDGEDIATYIYKNSGEYATTVKLSANQMQAFGL